MECLVAARCPVPIPSPIIRIMRIRPPLLPTSKLKFANTARARIATTRAADIHFCLPSNRIPPSDTGYRVIRFYIWSLQRFATRFVLTNQRILGFLIGSPGEARATLVILRMLGNHILITRDEWGSEGQPSLSLFVHPQLLKQSGKSILVLSVVMPVESEALSTIHTL